VDDALVEHGCIDLAKATNSVQSMHLTEGDTDCFEDNRLLLLGRTLLDSGGRTGTCKVDSRSQVRSSEYIGATIGEP